MAEGPEEDLVYTDEQRVWEALKFSQQVEDKTTFFSEKSQRRADLSEKIVKHERLSDIDDFQVLEANDQNGRNAILESIFENNLHALNICLDSLGKDAGGNLLYHSEDHDRNNCLMLALKTSNSEMVDNVIGHMERWLSKDKISDMIVASNFAEQNSFSIAIEDNKCAKKWILQYLIPKADFTAKNIDILWKADQYGHNTLVRAVMQSHFDIAMKMIKTILALRPDNIYGIFTVPNISENLNRTENNDIADNTTAVNDDAEISLIELILKKQEEDNNTEIEKLLSLYVTDMLAIPGLKINYMEHLFQPMREGGMCLFSQLINLDCQLVIRSLLRTTQFRREFWLQLDNPEGIYSWQRLLSQAMSSSMLALFNRYSPDRFLSLTNHSKARPQARLMFTKLHIDRTRDREGGTEECNSVHRCLTKIDFDSRVLSGEDRYLRKAQILTWFEKELREIKETTSILWIGVFAHGEEGIFFDSESQPVEINAIVVLANKYMHPGIPIVFFVQACRKVSETGTSPRINLKQFNGLIRTCLAGEDSVRSLYPGRLVYEIQKRGIFEITAIHNNVVKHIKIAHDPEMYSQTPEFTNILTKEQLLLKVDPE